jgi:predicted enzyme related to lactoylglutathione lyase
VVVPPMDSPPGRFAVVSDPFGVSFGIIALAS